jgi:hypothetical protein
LPLADIADAVKRSGWTVRVEVGSLSASGPWGYFGLLPGGSAAGEFEEILPIVQMKIAHPIFTPLEHWGSDPLPIALSLLQDIPNALIVDDYDVVLPVARYASKLKAAKTQRAE